MKSPNCSFEPSNGVSILFTSSPVHPILWQHNISRMQLHQCNPSRLYRPVPLSTFEVIECLADRSHQLSTYMSTVLYRLETLPSSPHHCSVSNPCGCFSRSGYLERSLPRVVLGLSPRTADSRGLVPHRHSCQIRYNVHYDYFTPRMGEFPDQQTS